MIATAPRPFCEILPNRKYRLNLHPGQKAAWNSERRIVLALGGSQSGKALDVNTPIPTPGGFKRMGDLRVGDVLFDKDGVPCRVIGTSPVYEDHVCYRVTFDDGTSVVADADHRWLTHTFRERRHGERPKVRTTREIFRTLKVKSGHTNHSVANCGALRTESRELPVPPYTLGAWLGDGSSRHPTVTTMDAQVLAEIRKDGFVVREGDQGTSDNQSGSFRIAYPGTLRGYRDGGVLRDMDKEKKWRRVSADYERELRAAANGIRSTTYSADDGETRRRPKHWPAVTAREFCDRRGLVLGQFMSWRVALRRRDREILEGVRINWDGTTPTCPTRHLAEVFRDLDLIRNKHIPKVYLYASAEQRLALLQGLMDTDGYCDKGGSCSFANTNRKLARGVLWLVRSLGIKARWHEGRARLYGRDCGPNYCVSFTTTVRVFRLKRKADRLPKEVRKDVLARYIRSVERVPSVPVMCVAVDSSSRTYLCTRACVPTHNTVLGPFWLAREIKRRGPGDYLIAGPNFPLLSKKVVPEFLKLFRSHLKWGGLVGRTAHFELNGNGEKQLWGKNQDEMTKVFFGHAMDPDSLESATAKAAWLDECGQKKFRLGAWEAINRRVAIHKGRLLLTTTPYSFGGWLKEEVYDRWKAGDPDIFVAEFESTVNPTYPHEVYERARATLPAWKFDLFYRAKFTKPAGAVYDCFDRGRHVCPPFNLPDAWPRYVGLDFGGVHTAAVFLAQELALASESAYGVQTWGAPTGRYYLYREYPERAAWQSRTAGEHAVKIYLGEPKLTKCVGGSGSEGQWRREFAAGGLPVLDPAVGDAEATGVEGTLRVGINRLYALLQEGNLVLFDTCKHTIEDLANYSYEVDEAGNVLPDKLEDKEMYHYGDSVRYIAFYLKRKQKEVWLS